MLVTEYRLIGLERLQCDEHMSATIEPFNKEETKKALIQGDKKYKEALWNYCEGNWGNLKALVIKDENQQLRVYKVEHIK